MPHPSPLPFDMLRDGAVPEGWSAVSPGFRVALTPRGDARDLADDVVDAITNEASLRPALRAALSPAADVNLADSILETIAREAAEDGDVGRALRATLTPADGIDVVEDVFAAIALEADDAIGAVLRADASAVQIPAIHLEDAVDAQMHAFELEGWDADALRHALSPRDTSARVDVEPAVMAHITGASGRTPFQVLQGGPSPTAAPAPHRAPRSTTRALLLCAAAAAAALAVWRPWTYAPVPLPEATVAAVDLDTARPLAEVNDAHIEALATGASVTAQVMQFEDGGPTIIMVEEL